jgi:hypothetical protein
MYNNLQNKEFEMDQKQLTQTISIFATLTVIGILMIVAPYRIEVLEPEMLTALQNSLPLVGSAMLGAGLVFFLLEMTRMGREKSI